MRFRLIEKDVVGTGTEFEQDKKKKLAHSKTYIPKVRSNKVDMNKIKNTKIGDDIHYYINGVEGRGIVVKMANEYLEVFKENGQLGTIHINDTFFVKDILVNKQWNDMDDQERYEALNKIHAPTPRFIMKVWEDLPEEIKILLQKSSKTINKVGSTYEEGESKESETKDHARTGFAQNEQFSKKKPKPCKCGDPECKDPKCEKHTDVKKAKGESEEHRYNRQFDHAGNRKQTAMGGEKEILGHIVGQGKGSAKEQADKKAKEIADKKAQEAKTVKEKPKEDKQDPNNLNYTMSGKRITAFDRKHNPKYAGKALYVEWLEKYHRESKPKMMGEQTEKEFLKSRRGDGTKNLTNRYFRDGQMFEGVGEGSGEAAYAKRYPTSNTAKRLADAKKPASQKRSAKQKPTGKFSEVETEAKEMTQAEKDRVATPEESNESFLKDAGKALYKSWLEFMTKPEALPKGDKRGDMKHSLSLYESLGSEEAKQQLTPNQFKTWEKEEREAQEDDPNQLEMYELDFDKDKKRKKEIESEDDKRLAARSATGSQPANPKNAAETYAERATLKAYEVWLDRQEKSQDVNKIQLRYEEHEQDSGKIEVEADPDNPGKMRRKRKPKKTGKEKNVPSDKVLSPKEMKEQSGQTKESQATRARMTDEPIDRKVNESTGGLGLTVGNIHQHASPVKNNNPINLKKSDVEHGVYGNVAGSDGVGVSTDTKVDVAEDTGYEERPHISVEEAGKLPRTTFNESGSELTVSGSQDSKDEPKFSQPHSQETVRKVGLPEQHPNTYGVRYGMKGGVKKVWCPEHQMWEETRKDWHE